MKYSMSRIALFVIILLSFYGCNFFDQPYISDPNNPSTTSVQENVSNAQLELLLTGLEERNRNSTTGFATFIGIWGREVIPMYASELRNLRITYGVTKSANAETDPDFYGNGNAWADPYSVIKQANLILRSLNNTNKINESQKNGYRGVVNTIKAYEYLFPLLTQKHSNGIRINVKNPLNPGPFVPFKTALQQIRDLFDTAESQLKKAGSEFAFSLSSGMANFNTPSKFIKLNRALAARAAIYAKDWEGGLQALQDSKPFFDLSKGKESLSKGAYFPYNGPPDSFNPFYYPRNVISSHILLVNPFMIKGAESKNNARFNSKFFKRDVPITLLDITAEYQDNRFASNTSPFPWIRNAGLILLYAEANAQLLNLSEAVNAINIIRETWGLSTFNSNDKGKIIDQILYERRYSLWDEFGTSWIDAKRYDRLDLMPEGKGQVFKYLARPSSEVNWENTHN